METLVESNRITSNDSVELSKGVMQAIEAIKEKVAKEDWRAPNFTINESIRVQITLLIAGMTLNQRKKLKNKINGCVYKQSMRSINTLLHFLHKRVYKEYTPAPYVIVSEKEEKIQTARKRYVEARNLAIKLYAEYKIEKGDYYKNKLAK
jgi:hypothetical protein